MGLDMYLDKELSISEYDNHKELMDKILSLVGVEDNSGNYRHISVVVPAIYWRKANAIHKWFVDNCQEGDDNCHTYYLEHSQLEELLETVHKQLQFKDEIILETQEGFFFGNTDKDEWYWSDLERTKNELERELKFVKEEEAKKRYWTFSYQSSW